MKEITPVYPLLKNRMALIESLKGEPILLVEYNSNNINIFSTVVLTTASGVCIANEILRSLKTGIEIKFSSFQQYNNLLKSIAEKLKIPYSCPTN